MSKNEFLSEGDEGGAGGVGGGGGGGRGGRPSTDFVFFPATFGGIGGGDDIDLRISLIATSGDGGGGTAINSPLPIIGRKPLGVLGDCSVFNLDVGSPWGQLRSHTISFLISISV